MKLIVFVLIWFPFLGCASSYEMNQKDNLEVHTFRREYQNIHLIKQKNGKYLMIDSGGYETAEILEKDFISKGINPKDIDYILITHAHWDHAAGSKYFQDKYNIPVLVGKNDERLLKQGKSDKLCPTDFMARSRLKEDENHTFQSPKITKWVDSETKLESFTNTTGRIIPLPGHTDGSLVFVIGKNAFVGDLFRGSLIGGNPSVHFYICDLEANRKDILKLIRNLAPEAEYFYPGHFGPVLFKKDIEKYFD